MPTLVATGSLLIVVRKGMSWGTANLSSAQPPVVIAPDSDLGQLKLQLTSHFDSEFHPSGLSPEGPPPEFVFTPLHRPIADSQYAFEIIVVEIDRKIVPADTKVLLDFNLTSTKDPKGQGD